MTFDKNKKSRGILRPQLDICYSNDSINIESYGAIKTSQRRRSGEKRALLLCGTFVSHFNHYTINDPIGQTINTVHL